MSINAHSLDYWPHFAIQIYFTFLTLPFIFIVFSPTSKENSSPQIFPLKRWKLSCLLANDLSLSEILWVWKMSQNRIQLLFLFFKEHAVLLFTEHAKFLGSPQPEDWPQSDAHKDVIFNMISMQTHTKMSWQRNWQLHWTLPDHDFYPQSFFILDHRILYVWSKGMKKGGVWHGLSTKECARS